jgi:mediator of RNA polymerase II transcription subunit 6
MNDMKDNPLFLSWHDSSWIPHLNQGNVLDYFSERSNPFYDRTCNNEILKMQRGNPEQLNNMQGLEYILLHVQEPILYVIRKQHRHSPGQVTPQADYYILAGYVYQAPDLNAVINSRTLTCVHHLISAFDEVHSFMRYHPTKGYSWDFGKDTASDAKDKEKAAEKAKEKTKEEFGSTFQRRRVDLLLGELAKKFPPKIPAPVVAPVADTKPSTSTTAGGAGAAPASGTEATVTEVKVEVKTEKPDSAPTTTSTTNSSSTPSSSTTAPSSGRSSSQPPEAKKARLA